VVPERDVRPQQSPGRRLYADLQHWPARRSDDLTGEQENESLEWAFARAPRRERPSQHGGCHGYSVECAPHEMRAKWPMQFRKRQTTCT